MRTITLTLLLLPLSGLAQTRPPDLITRGSVERREYASENGRRIRITSLGNLVGFESPFGFEHLANPGGAREGYTLGYVHPQSGQVHVVYNVNDLYSDVLRGSRDLVPQSFRGPADGTFAINTPVTATAVVDTSDGLLRLTHEISWRAGTGTVTIATAIANRTQRPIQLRGFKRHAGIDLDGHGHYGRALTRDYSKAELSITSFAIVCNCGPSPSPGPEPIPFLPRLASHLFTMKGSPLPAQAAINDRGDPVEVTSAEYQSASDRPGLRRNESNSGTLIWGPSALGQESSISFTVEYQVQ